MSHKLEVQNIEASDSSRVTSTRYITNTEKQITIEDLRKRYPTMSIQLLKKKTPMPIEESKNHQVLIVEGLPGAGMTTQIPQFLREVGFCDGNKKIGCTQLKRMGAIKAATRVAEEIGVNVGDEVGYSIRFEDRTSPAPKTQIKYMTDGVLLREFLADMDLQFYSVIMIDQADERSLNTDLLLSLMKGSNVKLIICSTTLVETRRFSEFYNNAPVFPVTGGNIPLDTKEKQKPEIHRVHLANVVLLLKSLGVNDLDNLNFVDPPPKEALDFALTQLYAAGVLNQLGEVTTLGRKTTEFPVDVMMSKMLIAASEQYKCSVEILSIVAMLSVNNPIFCSPKDNILRAHTAKKNFDSPDGDLLTLLKIYNAWVNSRYSEEWCSENFIQLKTMKMAKDVREQLEALMQTVGLEIVSNPDSIIIRKAITAAYFFNLARLCSETGEYKNLKNGQALKIHPYYSLFHQQAPKWIIYDELAIPTQEFMQHVTPVQSSWILEVVPNYYTAEELDQ